MGDKKESGMQQRDDLRRRSYQSTGRRTVACKANGTCGGGGTDDDVMTMVRDETGRDETRERSRREETTAYCLPPLKPPKPPLPLVAEPLEPAVALAEAAALDAAELAAAPVAPVVELAAGAPSSVTVN